MEGTVEVPEKRNLIDWLLKKESECREHGTTTGNCAIGALMRIGRGGSPPPSQCFTERRIAERKVNDPPPKLYHRTEVSEPPPFFGPDTSVDHSRPPRIRPSSNRDPHGLEDR